jgi:hypothetical protein
VIDVGLFNTDTALLSTFSTNTEGTAQEIVSCGPLSENATKRPANLLILQGYRLTTGR